MPEKACRSAHQKLDRHDVTVRRTADGIFAAWYSSPRFRFAGSSDIGNSASSANIGMPCSASGRLWIKRFYLRSPIEAGEHSILILGDFDWAWPRAGLPPHQVAESKMALQLGDIAPDFEADTTQGHIRFHEWLGNAW